MADDFADESRFTVDEAQPLAHALGVNVDAGLKRVAARDQLRNWANETHRVGALADVAMSTIMQLVSVIADLERRVQLLEAERRI